MVDFVLKVTECKRKYDGLPDDREKQRIVDQILLQISRGGIGIQSSEDTRRMAYVGSWALIGQRIETILGIEQMDQVRTDLAIHMSQMVIAGIVREGDLTVQSELSRKYAAIKGNKTFEMVVPLVPATGVSNHDSDPLTTARVHQAKANMDSVASAWLSALPTHPRAVMNNSAFDIAIRNRLLLDCLDDGEEAVTRACRGCRKRESYNGSHVRCGCRKMVLQGTRQPIRNKQHTEMQEALKAIITSTPDYGYAVSNRPSNLCDKFGLIEGEALDEGQQLMYGDVLLIDKTGTRPDIVIDITVASTHSANHHSTQPGDMADKAEKTKRDKWRRKGFDITDNRRARMVVFAVDQSGALGRSARGFLRELSGDDSYKWRSRCEWLSVEMQGILTRTIVQARALTFTISARQPDRRSRTDIAIDEEGSVVGSVSTSEASEDSRETIAVVRRRTRSSRLKQSPGGLLQSLQLC